MVTAASERFYSEIKDSTTEEFSDDVTTRVSFETSYDVLSNDPEIVQNAVTSDDIKWCLEKLSGQPDVYFPSLNGNKRNTPQQVRVQVIFTTLHFSITYLFQPLPTTFFRSLSGHWQ